MTHISTRDKRRNYFYHWKFEFVLHLELFVNGNMKDALINNIHCAVLIDTNVHTS